MSNARRTSSRTSIGSTATPPRARFRASSFVDPAFDDNDGSRRRTRPTSGSVSSSPRKVVHAVTHGQGVGQDPARLALRRARRLLRPCRAAAGDRARLDRAEPAAGRDPGRLRPYGFRVPAVIISPYARPNYVSHVVHDHTSVMKLIETKWNLPALTFRDANADNLLDAIDLSSRAGVRGTTGAAGARARVDGSASRARLRRRRRGHDSSGRCAHGDTVTRRQRVSVTAVALSRSSCRPPTARSSARSSRSPSSRRGGRRSRASSTRARASAASTSPCCGCCDARAAIPTTRSKMGGRVRYAAELHGPPPDELGDRRSARRRAVLDDHPLRLPWARSGRTGARAGLGRGGARRART